MNVPHDILVIIFLQLHDRQDMLSFLLTCKYFSQITNKYFLWDKLYKRYLGPFKVIKINENGHERNWPDMSTLRNAFRCNFDAIDIDICKIFNIYDIQKGPEFYAEEILGIFNIKNYGISVIHRGMSKAFIKTDRYYDSYCVARENHFELKGMFLSLIHI